MPRPRQPRIIRAKAPINLYKPQGVPARKLQWANLSHEGLESLSLVDGQGLSQAEAAKMMGVSAPTICRVLAQARHIVAQALSQGWAIQIQGGDYLLAGAHEEVPADSGQPGWRGRRRQGGRRNPDGKEETMPRGNGKGQCGNQGRGQGKNQGRGGGGGGGGCGQGRGQGPGQGMGQGSGPGKGKGSGQGGGKGSGQGRGQGSGQGGGQGSGPGRQNNQSS